MSLTVRANSTALLVLVLVCLAGTRTTTSTAPWTAAQRGRRTWASLEVLEHAAQEKAKIAKAAQAKSANAVAAMLSKATAGLLPLPRGCMAWCPVLGVHTPLPNASSPPDAPRPATLAAVINAVYTMQPLTWDLAMADRLPSVAAGGAWWSGRPTVPGMPVTVTTQSTVDRLPQLYSQCMSWRGPLSAVVFLGLVQDDVRAGLSELSRSLLHKAATHVSNFFADIEADKDACKLDILLVYEVYTEARAIMLYPINTLRNLARLQARTPLIALLDVDMLVSGRLYKDLRDFPSLSSRLVRVARTKTVFVLPAFETSGSMHEAAALADLLATKEKPFLIKSIKQGEAGPFDYVRFPEGHNCTLFGRWYQTKKPYHVRYGHRYEPWTIVDRTIVPWHDTRFRGYGQNKIVHIAHMNYTGFKFVVLANAFIVHRAHEATAARWSLVASKAEYDAALLRDPAKQPVDKSTVYAHTKALWDEAQQQMAAGVFEPVLDAATLNCRDSLSWWKGSVNITDDVT